MNCFKIEPLSMKLAIAVLLILIQTIAKFQDGNWDVYLAQFVKEFNGVYDGWETLVLKE